VSGQLEFRTAPGSATPLAINLRLARFAREFLRGALDESPDYAVGALSGSRFHFTGEEVARAQSASLDPIPGLAQPTASTATPWGVPAFFLSGASSGFLAWNHYGETRAQVDLTYGGIRRLDLYAGGQFSAQQVRTYQRALGYLPVGGEVPPPAISAFSPRAAAAYLEGQAREADIAVTVGLRYDQFSAGSNVPGETRGAQRAVSPRLAVSTVLRGATVVVSYGRFTQAPDYQFLVDAAFDDTTRTGRFRRGNPDLGYERASQYELSLRIRPREAIALRAGVYVKRLTGLVASVPLGINPDSTIFGNADAGTVKGLELLLERELQGGVGLRVAYTLQQALATATDPFLLDRLVVVDPFTGDTTRPARAEFPLDFDRRQTLTVILRGRASGAAGPRLLGVRPLGGLEGAVIFRALSGLPYSRSDSTGSLPGLPNASRLPGSSSLDLLIRRPLRLGRMSGGVYCDVRNLLNRRNIVAVRRDTGLPEADDGTITQLAEAAYQAHPETIPYESARYRAYADLDHNGFLEGRTELLPLYLAAARDYSQPIFAYGIPRLVRLGFELLF
jgi:outer membrane receptor protein involved in Fe transport